MLTFEYDSKVVGQSMHRQTGRATHTFDLIWTQHTKKGKYWTKRPERANFGLSDQNKKILEIVLKKGAWIISTARIVLQLWHIIQ